MNLYLISQDVNNSYDSINSAVVVAPDEETARRIRPDKFGPRFKPHIWVDGEENIGWLRHLGSWVDHPSQVTVQLLGVAKDGMPIGSVLASD